ncbi:MAG: sodium:alanine symporter family protein [Bacteroidaceae bacterium]|nr:sodium:alanine symporter family protein [Bacteroidaceae bacterium]
MEKINTFFSDLSSVLWGWPMIILLLGTHLFLTIRLKFPQRYIFKAIRLSVSKDKDATGDVSQFGALTTALAATIGTGNIVGVGTAIALGGPGAVFWCWLTGVFGIATKYSEGLLAIKYRVKAEDGRMLGGPMYALEHGLAENAKGVKRHIWKALAIAFALFTAIAAFGIGSTVQANAITTICSETYSLNPALIGGITTILAATVVIGGIRSIAKVCQMLVPFMAILYILGCIVILFMNGEYVMPAISLIVRSAFSPTAAGGGLVGASIMLAARYGIARGLFSNESGLGSAPLVAAAAQTKNPVRQALVSSSGTFWDTVVICALTGIVLVSSILAFPDIDTDNGGILTKMAFSKIPYVGQPILVFGSLTFAFSTILGWCYYGERGIEYLTHSRKWFLAYRIVFLATIFLGSLISLNIVWNIADCLNALMAIPNLLSLLFLSGVIVRETKTYLWDKNLDKE